MGSIKLGQKAEIKAEKWLRKQGLQTLARNYHCRLGEIDLVMLDADSLIFVEVRFRAYQHFGAAVATVDKHKQRKIIRTARFYLQCNPELGERACRFDVVGIEPAAEKKWEYHWIKSAFFAEE